MQIVLSISYHPANKHACIQHQVIIIVLVKKSKECHEGNKKGNESKNRKVLQDANHVCMRIWHVNLNLV